jgi:hypothetical protein
MKTSFKLELVVAKHQSDTLVELLGKAGIIDYSVMNIERGSGKKSGEVRHTGIADENNVCFLVICTNDQKEKSIPLLTPFLKTAGGIAFYSEVTLIG